MVIPMSIEIIITIALFLIAGSGSVVGYFLVDIRDELRGMREDIQNSKTDQDKMDKRLGILEMRLNLCRKCSHPASAQD